MFTIVATNLTAEEAALAAAAAAEVNVNLWVSRSIADPVQEERATVRSYDAMYNASSGAEVPADAPKVTLTEHILHHCSRPHVTRGHLVDIAKQYGFNPGSVSPTLVKLTSKKLLKRTGPGEYATTEKGKARK
jgi:hypothetical protein